MRLKTWMNQNLVSQKDLVSKLKVTKSYVSLLVNGLRVPSIDLALKIEEMTKGAVTLKDWK